MLTVKWPWIPHSHRGGEGARLWSESLGAFTFPTGGQQPAPGNSQPLGTASPPAWEMGLCGETEGSQQPRFAGLL